LLPSGSSIQSDGRDGAGRGGAAIRSAPRLARNAGIARGYADCLVLLETAIEKARRQARGDTTAPAPCRSVAGIIRPDCRSA
jgi:hypothetical protein